MANFSPSNLVAAQLMLQDKFKSPENRFKASPVMSMGLKNQGILVQDYQSLRTREDRALYAYLLNRTKRSTTSSRTHNHSGNRGDSTQMSLTWTTFVDKFSLSIKQMDNNMVGFNETLAHQIENAMKNIIESAETYIVSNLQTNRTQVNDATANGTFNATNDVFEISSSTQFWQILKSMMRQNDYKGMFDVITNSYGFVDAEYQAAQGQSNAANTQFQFQGMNIAESYELADTNYPATNISLIMPEGGFAVLPWIPKQNRNGYGDYSTYNGGYGSLSDPFGLGMQFAVHGYSERADASASNGSAQDDVMQFELSVDLAIPLAPLSTANETVIFEAAKV